MDSQLYPAQSTVPSYWFIFLTNLITFDREVAINLLNISIKFYRNIIFFVVDMVIRSFHALDTDSSAWINKKYGA